MAKDLKSLGKRGWLNTLTRPKTPRPAVDSGVVTRYGAVPHADVEEMRRLVTLDQNNVELKDMLAFTLYSQDRLDEAITIYRELLSQGHKPASQRLYLGNCYYRKQLLHLAVKEWQWITEQSGVDPALKRRAQTRMEKVRAGVAIDFGD
jgi:cytochrome c-type biogenesis protein CcmH/NrfG